MTRFDWSGELRSWFYSIQGAATAAVLLWAHFRHQEFLLGTRWPDSLMPTVLKHAAESDLYAWVCTGLFVVGLVSRNLIRNWNFKVSREGASATISGRGDGGEA